MSAFLQCLLASPAVIEVPADLLEEARREAQRVEDEELERAVCELEEGWLAAVQ